MFGTRTLWAAGAVVAGLLLPAQAMAQYDAYTRADLNLRVGPGTEYGIIDVIPDGYPVDVLGCLDDYSWCDIEWDGLRGWVAASYLVQPDTRVYIPQVAPQIGLPTITFSFGTYHDRHYRDRPWYRERQGRWRGRDWRRDRRSDDPPRVETGRERDRDERRERERAEEREERQRAEERRERQRAEERRERQRAEERRERQRAEERRERQRTEEPRERQRTEEPRERQRTEPSPERREAERLRQREQEEEQRRRSQRIQREQRGQPERETDRGR